MVEFPILTKIPPQASVRYSHNFPSFSHMILPPRKGTQHNDSRCELLPVEPLMPVIMNHLNHSSC